MKRYTVLLSDGTTGTLTNDTIDYQDLDSFIGETITIHLYDENGNEIEKDGILEEILTEDNF